MDGAPPSTYRVAMTTAKANVLRTVLQMIVAVCVAIPSAIVLVPIPDKYQGYVALTIGIAGAVVVIVTAVQNAIEARAGTALLRNPEGAAELVTPAPQDEPPAAPPTGGNDARGPP